MSFLSNLKANTPVSLTDYATNGLTGGKSFFEYNGKTILFDLNCEEDYCKAYLSCAPLKAVINRRAQMFVNGKTKVLNPNTDNPARGAYAKQIQALLDRPNVLQTGKQFKAQQNIYIDLFGYCPVLKVTPIGSTEIKAMWNLPPWLFDLDFTGNWYNQFTKKDIYKAFYLNWAGQKRTLDYDSVFLILDNSIGTDDDGNLLMPDSRCKSLELDISNDVSAKKSANTLINKKGAIGILSNKGKDVAGNIPLKKGEKETVQADFSRYGLTGQEFQVIITDADLQWQSMSFPMKDMMLFETMNASLANICNGMGMYPYIMANALATGSTFTNLNEAEKAQYQNFIIPDDEARTEQLSQNIIDPEQNVYLTVDYSHIEALQQSAKERAEGLTATNTAYDAMYKAGLVKKNEWTQALGLPSLPDGDKYIYEQTDTVPLAVKLGVGGTQALQEVLLSALSSEQKINALQILFGLTPEDANKMAGGSEQPPKETVIIPPNEQGITSQGTGA